MTRARTARSAAALGLLLLLGACAAQDAGGSPPDAVTPGLPGAPDELVLQVSYTGGFVTPEMLAARLPLVSVYADGRVITEGPVPAIYPGPAWPNVQVQEIDRQAVHTLVERARAAGVTETGDLGTPPLADVPSTRFTLATATDTAVREVYGLTEVGGLDPGGSGLSDEQIAARAELRGFLDALTDLPGTLGPDAVSPVRSYRPEAVAAVVRPWTATGDGNEPDLVHPEMPWPGPDLPGEPVGPLPDLSCVTATGEQAQAVASAAQAATSATPWVTDDGARWAVTFRPLLPHESGCDDLIG
ncbi:hypothetical protein [Modestobacter lapidis]|nr:hypothetical protein [Modestobacter lapidis]